jgi:hypothetical protein
MYDNGDYSSDPNKILGLLYIVTFTRFSRKILTVFLTGVSIYEADWCCKEERPVTFDFTQDVSASDSPFLSPVLKNGRGYVQIVA